MSKKRGSKLNRKLERMRVKKKAKAANERRCESGGQRKRVKAILQNGGCFSDWVEGDTFHKLRPTLSLLTKTHEVAVEQCLDPEKNPEALLWLEIRPRY